MGMGMDHGLALVHIALLHMDMNMDMDDQYHTSCICEHEQASILSTEVNSIFMMVVQAAHDA